MDFTWPLWVGHMAVLHLTYSIGLPGHKGQKQARPVNNIEYLLFQT